MANYVYIVLDNVICPSTSEVIFFSKICNSLVSLTKILFVSLSKDEKKNNLMCGAASAAFAVVISQCIICILVVAQLSIDFQSSLQL